MDFATDGCWYAEVVSVSVLRHCVTRWSQVPGRVRMRNVFRKWMLRPGRLSEAGKPEFGSRRGLGDWIPEAWLERHTFKYTFKRISFPKMEFPAEGLFGGRHTGIRKPARAPKLNSGGRAGNAHF